MTTYLLDARTLTPHFPGIGRYVANLAPALAAQLEPFERLLILHAPQGRGRLAALACLQVKLVCSEISPFALRQQWQIPALLRELGPLHLYHSTYLQMPYSLRLPTVLTFYDQIPLQQPKTVSLRARLFFQLMLRMALTTADEVVAISEDARQALLARFKLPPQRVTTTPLAADERFHPQSDGEIARVRAAYNLPPQMVLFVGINKPHKNLANPLQPPPPPKALQLPPPLRAPHPPPSQRSTLPSPTRPARPPNPHPPLAPRQDNYENMHI